MAQKLIQTQEQKLQLQQRLTAQQLLQVKLLEMPLTGLEESVRAELDDNPALETLPSEDETADSYEGVDTGDDAEDYESQSEREERADALDSALENIGKDDVMTEGSYDHRNNADYEEIVYGDTVSFYDKLKEQVGMLDLTEKQQSIMEYLIGSLDDDGLLRKSIESICDELTIYQYMDVKPAEIEEVLYALQGLDPAGIGARDLQECLLLQVERMPESRIREALRELITQHYDEFTKKHWDKIQEEMGFNDTQMETLREEVRKLNPKPGAALGETEGRNLQQITPDFIVDTADDGTITFSLNQGDLPELTVAPSFKQLINSLKGKKKTKQEKEALLYAQEKTERAQGFINAIEQRRHTLMVTMKAIIDIQRKFFQDGDETELRPMILKDLEERTGLDKSTISRVSNVKYAQTKWGTFPLRFFFTDSYTTESGEELSTRKMKVALRELIEKEDKCKPMSDEALTKKMQEKGFPVARRTVSKYREQMGIPVARLRKG